ncbi:protein-methionine-sulfoxide reductase heme-binding subunit MsrQ [Mesobacterium sp. TK19101]|uniref:Protein-methionine-sulfoxide reductase heme-binding subunit MsrQ n=1 Tax=Mesobacterium hydrothermale TaxID=3111907 RepID=A0ABU6HG04_9RHOB|nr:protein-methionine-sulfoxide reductase heme-binding subunit MsrQ [Mesobacterium sp. TK19101]MEC3861389.1 protein-methionine-sulfoxide reductase heme-binding subunit MsrQ [Mesobacterium sp. TK19101]
MGFVEAFNGSVRKLPVPVVYGLLTLPFAWLLVQLFTGGLGIDPVKALEHQLGLTALQLMVLVLAITPLRRILRLNLLRFRRAIGVMAFVYVVLHLLVWLVLDVQILAQVWADILKRPYITIGMVAFALMIPLALSSNNFAVRKLGPLWAKLHKLTYAVALLGAVHFTMLVKGFQIEPVVYLTLVAILLALRLPPMRKLRLA